MPRILGGTAKNGTVSDQLSRSVMWSTIRMPASSSMLWIGRVGHGVVDVDGIDAGDNGASGDQGFGDLDRQERMLGRAVPIGAPVAIPAGGEQDGTSR